MEKLRYKNRRYLELLVAFLALSIVGSLYMMIMLEKFIHFIHFMISAALFTLILTKHTLAKDVVRYWGILLLFTGAIRLLIAFVQIMSSSDAGPELVFVLDSGFSFLLGLLLFMYNDKMFEMEVAKRTQKVHGDQDDE